MNARIVPKGRDNQAFIISPPNDFEHPQAFDLFIDQMRSVVSGSNKRLYFGQGNIIKKRLGAFHRDDPVMTAVGGLVHTLLMRMPWMEQTSPSVFAIDY